MNRFLWEGFCIDLFEAKSNDLVRGQIRSQRLGLGYFKNEFYFLFEIFLNFAVEIF